MNDATFPFHGAVKGSLLNMQSGEEINVFEQTFSLPAGAGVRRLWCAIGSAQPAPPSDSEFVVYPGMVPTERLNFSKTMTGVSVRSCEALCHIGQCVGFTRADESCWLYRNVSRLAADPTADYYAHKTLAHLPPFPNASVPHRTHARSCLPFSTLFNGSIGCGMDGEACALVLAVHDSDGRHS